jgi:hypothetical protein
MVPTGQYLPLGLVDNRLLYDDDEDDDEKRMVDIDHSDVGNQSTSGKFCEVVNHDL